MRLVPAAAMVGPESRQLPPGRATNRRRGQAPGLARVPDEPKKHIEEKAGPGCATSMGRLRRFLRGSARCGASLPASPHSTHVLHTFPFFRSDNHNKLGHKDVAVQGAARHKMVAHLHT